MEVFEVLSRIPETHFGMSLRCLSSEATDLTIAASATDLACYLPEYACRNPQQ